MFIFFFKIYRKDLCKSLRVGVSFLIKLTEQSFISYYRLQLYNKRPQHGLFPANFEKLLRFLPEHPQANTFVPFRRLWDFTTALKIVAIFLPLRKLPLRSPTKTIIIWHSKQIKTLYNQWFGAVLWNSLSEKKLNIHKKTSAVECRLYKIMG